MFMRRCEVGMKVLAWVVGLWTMSSAQDFGCGCRFFRVDLRLSERFCGELELLARIRCNLKGQ